MTFQGTQTEVAIVGAGPTGLALGLGLARHGVRSVVLERADSLSDESRAAGVHVRTREVFRQWGVEARVLDEGELVPVLRQVSADDGSQVATWDFRVLEEEVDAPGLVMLEQARTERILLDAARDSGLCEVRFGAEACGLEPGDDAVSLTVREREDEWRLEARYIVGCDGAGSFVRKALDLPFDGITYSLRPMLADVIVRDARDALPWPRLHNAAGRVVAALRIRAGLWRIIRISADEPAGDDVPLEEVRSSIDAVLGSPDGEVVWASRFRIHRRSTPRFRQGRVLLAGDAAHVHSPIGGQGMNAGVQDAHNLAWKLAAVLRGDGEQPLLDAYDVERRSAVVGSVSRYTDVATRAFLQAPTALRSLSFRLLRGALRLPPLHRRMVRALAMIDVRYADSPILGDDDAAGERLPNVRLRTPGGDGVRLYDLMPCARLLLLVGEEVQPPAGAAPAHVLRIADGHHVDESGRLRSLLGGRDGAIMVRPDMHIEWARRHG